MNYQLTDGRTLTATEISAQGMAGEPMSYLKFSIDNQDVLFREIQHLLNARDFMELDEHMDDLSDTNEHNAISWSI